jgi:hypothetical protein
MGYGLGVMGYGLRVMEGTCNNKKAQGIMKEIDFFIIVP